MMIDTESSEAKLLTEFCSAHTVPNIETVAFAFTKVLTAFGWTPETFDPLALSENATDPQLVRERVKWYTTCIANGQLHVYNPSARFRSRQINFSFYNATCEALFGIPVSVGEKYNWLFGSLNLKGSSTLFTYSKRDLRRQLMEISSDMTNDVFADPIDGWSTSNELQDEKERDSQSLRDVRRRAIARMTEWVVDSVNPCNGHGQRILNQCKCRSGWEGITCNATFVTYATFLTGSALAALILTAVIFVTTVYTWRIFLRRRIT
jgi:hypothetical protein